MPNKLFITDSNSSVEIAEIALVNSKQQVLLGNLESDLILRTAGNIKVQIKDKFYDLPISLTDQNVTTVNSVVTILSKVTDLDDLLYPGDGKFIYITESKGFYISNNNEYLPLNNTKDNNKIFLSFTDSQTLSGDQKYLVSLNAGSYINKISDVTNFKSNDVFTNQIVYSILEGKHYQLSDITEPYLVDSWKELYLNLKTGGIVNGPVTIQQVSDSSLAILSDKSSLIIANNDKSKGLLIGNDNGDITFNSFINDSAKGFAFNTINSLGAKVNPLSLLGNCIGISGLPNFDYNLTVNGNSLFKNDITIKQAIKSPDFISGMLGNGFKLDSDTSGKYTLEVDKLIVRSDTKLNNNSYDTKGTQGAVLSNFNILFTYVDFVETIPIYIKASVSGKYSDTNGAIRLLKNRASNVKVIRSTLSSLNSNNLTKSYDTIKVSYGIGDIYDDNTSDTTITYNKKADGTYYIPSGNFTYNSSTNSFIPGSDLLNIDNINVYYVKSNCQDTISVGDLLYFKSWNENKQFSSALHVEVVLKDIDGYYVYSYGDAKLAVDMRVIKIGNKITGGGLIQTNAADLTNPFIELVSNITSFSDFYENYYYESSIDFQDPDDLIEDSYTTKEHTRVKFGDLSNIIDNDLNLNAKQYGLYSDNVFLKGNYVLNSAIFNNIGTTSSYSPFLMLDSSGKMSKIDLTSKIQQWDNNTGSSDTLQIITSRGNTTDKEIFAKSFRIVNDMPISGQDLFKSTIECKTTDAGYLNGARPGYTFYAEGYFTAYLYMDTSTSFRFKNDSSVNADHRFWTDSDFGIAIMPIASSVVLRDTTGSIQSNKGSFLGDVTVATDVYANNFRVNSSRGFKEHILPLKIQALDLLNQTKIYTYRYKYSEIERVGIIAEETDSTISGLQHNSFQISDTVALLIKAVQELSDKITKLEWLG